MGDFLVIVAIAAFVILMLGLIKGLDRLEGRAALRHLDGLYVHNEHTLPRHTTRRRLRAR